MKIAVSGSAGTGKSTLAQALAGSLRIAYIPEHYELLFAQPGALNSPPPILADLFNRVLDLKLSEQERAGDFVVDRSPADLLNLAMRTRLVTLDEAARAFYNRCREAMAVLELVIIPPWGVIDLQNCDAGENKMQRVTNPWLQLINHASISGQVRMFAGEHKILYLPDTPGAREHWLEIALKRVNTPS